MYIITSKTRSKIYRSPSDMAKMAKDVHGMMKSEVGCDNLVPNKKQSLEKVAKDIKQNKNKLKEMVAEGKEKDLSILAKKRKDRGVTNIQDNIKKRKT